ncbi:MAG: TetR/AcrR family transcriptional regulator [Acidimicrobiales bacterium]
MTRSQAGGGPRRGDGRAPYNLDTVVDVALDVFLQRGYDATSMEHLAAAAGVTKSAFYYHVSGKEELLERGLDRATTALFAILDEPGPSDGTASDRLAFVLRRLVEVETGLLPEVSVLLRSRGNSAIERSALDRRRDFDHAVAALIRAAAREGEIRADIDPELAARLVIGMATWVVEWYRPGGKLGGHELAGAILAIVLDGLRPRP